MRDLVFHPDTGLLLDFADEEFGGSAQTAIIEDWQDWHHRRSARQGEFICHRHRNHERPWLYLQQRGPLLVACHWAGTELAGSHEISHGVSDEHRRQVEYVQRAGEAAGFDVRTEVRLPTQVRPDAVIYGSVNMGVEVQRSDLSVSVAKARTTKIRRAGVTPVWFSDRRANPPWLWHVPSVRMSQDVSWDALPPHRTVTVWSGVRAIVGRRCRNIQNSQCPRRRVGCNAWHVDHDPRPTFVDDLAEGCPAGDLVPIRYRALSGREFVVIVSRNDKMRYETLTGLSGDLPLKVRTVKPQHTERIACSTDAGVETPLVASGGWDFPQYVPAPRCEVHEMPMMELVPGRYYCRFCFQAGK